MIHRILRLVFLVCLPEVKVSDGRCQPHGRGLRNYLTYFFVYSARRQGRACARARIVPGTPVGHAPVRSQVFERRWPPGPVAVLSSDGLAAYDRLVGFTSGRRDMGLRDQLVFHVIRL